MVRTSGTYASEAPAATHRDEDGPSGVQGSGFRVHELNFLGVLSGLQSTQKVWAPGFEVTVREGVREFSTQGLRSRGLP